ncbi:MAG: T9SS type A sorting domain-containing protein, partial [Bacteroidota bacterium]
REDYEFVAHAGQADYLDEHNGRFCVTPEYPNGIYCYFATVDADWNSAYPYAVGPYFYGNKTASKVTTIGETVTTYTSTANIEDKTIEFSVFPNPANDLLIIQVNGLNEADLNVELYDLSGKMVAKNKIIQGSTISYFDVSTVYSGIYFLKVGNKTIEVKIGI